MIKSVHYLVNFLDLIEFLLSLASQAFATMLRQANGPLLDICNSTQLSKTCIGYTMALVSKFWIFTKILLENDFSTIVKVCRYFIIPLTHSR